MKNRYSLYILLGLLLSTTSIYAQEYKNEIGIKVATVQIMQPTIYGGCNQNVCTQFIPFYNTFLNLQADRTWAFNNDNLKHSGISIPDIFYRRNIKNRWWLSGTLSAHSYSESLKPNSEGAGYHLGTYSEYYTQYKYKEKAIALTTSLQYQWLKKRVSISSGAQIDMYYRSTNRFVVGQGIGCFGTSNIQQDQKKRYFGSNINAAINTYISMPVYKNYSLGYLVEMSPIVSTLSQSFTLSCFF